MAPALVHQEFRFIACNACTCASDSKPGAYTYFSPLITKYMFRYISALSFGRVPRDLIMEPRLVSCIARLQPHPSPTGNGGGRPSSFQPSFPFPHFFFSVWHSEIGQEKLCCYFKKTKGKMNVWVI